MGDAPQQSEQPSGADALLSNMRVSGMKVKRDVPSSTGLHALVRAQLGHNAAGVAVHAAQEGDRVAQQATG